LLCPVFLTENFYSKLNKLLQLGTRIVVGVKSEKKKREQDIAEKKSTYTCVHTKIQSSMKLHRILVEAPISPYFCVNSMTCFSHTGPLSDT
jgi:hypothetical protein